MHTPSPMPVHVVRGLVSMSEVLARQKILTDDEKAAATWVQDEAEGLGIIFPESVQESQKTLFDYQASFKGDNGKRR